MRLATALLTRSALPAVVCLLLILAPLSALGQVVQFEGSGNEDAAIYGTDITEFT